MVLMEVVPVARGWNAAAGLPPAVLWKGPISEANADKVQDANHPDVFFASTSTHRTVPFKYKYIAEHAVGLYHIYEYHRKTTGDIVLVRQVSQVPMIISLRCIRQFHQHTRIVGTLMSGDIVYLKDVHVDDGCKAGVVRKEVHARLIELDKISKLRKVKLIDESAFEIKGNKWIVKPRQ